MSTTTSGSGLGERVRDIVLRRIAEDRLVLPAMPGHTARAVALLQQPEVTLRQVAELLAGDPVLAVQLVRLASGASMGSPIRGVEQAVTRLGAQRLRTFLIESSARKLFESKDRSIAEAWRGLWSHCTAVALLARDVAALCGSDEGEVAYLAGLLHDVGKPVIASVLLEAERLAGTRGRAPGWVRGEAWLAAISEVHRPVGVALAERWGLPDPVVAAVRDCGDYDVAERTCVANFVRFANAVAKEQGLHVGPADLEEARALVMVGRSLLGVDDAVLARLVADLAARVQAQAGQPGGAA